MISSGEFSGTRGDRGQAACYRVAGSAAGHGRFRGELSPARLADQPTALLGRTHPDRSIAPSVASCRCPTRTCRCCCRRMPSSCPPANRRSSFHEGFLHADLPALRRAAKRETDTMDTFHVLVVVSIRLCERRLRRANRYARFDPLRPAEGAYWLPVDSVYRRDRARDDAPALHPLLYQGHARHGRRGTSTSRCCACSTRAPSWAKTTRR